MKKQNTLVSILIINYNNEKLISRAINSCLAQNYNNIEILIYDDKSTDNFIYRIKKFLKNKKIHFFVNKGKKKKVASFDAMNGYLNLFKKSKGSIICLLDSDDFYHRNKIKTIVQYFRKNCDKEFLQNLPIIRLKNKLLYKKNKNNFLSFWPYLAPESCISFKRNFMNSFIKTNKSLCNKHNLLWLGFRLGVYAYFFRKSFGSIDKHLTYYESLGQSKFFLFMNASWFIRRKQSFDYLSQILRKKKYFSKNLDYIITKFICKILKIYHEKKNFI